MKLFHLIVATPVQAQPHQLHRVQYSEYIVVALTLQAAYGAISEHTMPVVVASAPEVWGRALTRSVDGVVVSPSTKLQSQTDFEQHMHWSRVQEQYTLVHKGPESLQQWTERMFAEYMESQAQRTVR